MFFVRGEPHSEAISRFDPTQSGWISVALPVPACCWPLLLMLLLQRQLLLVQGSQPHSLAPWLLAPVILDHRLGAAPASCKRNILSRMSSCYGQCGAVGRGWLDCRL